MNLTSLQEADQQKRQSPQQPVQTQPFLYQQSCTTTAGDAASHPHDHQPMMNSAKTSSSTVHQSTDADQPKARKIVRHYSYSYSYYCHFNNWVTIERRRP